MATRSETTTSQESKRCYGDPSSGPGRPARNQSGDGEWRPAFPLGVVRRAAGRCCCPGSPPWSVGACLYLGGVVEFLTAELLHSAVLATSPPQPRPDPAQSSQAQVVPLQSSGAPSVPLQASGAPSVPLQSSGAQPVPLQASGAPSVPLQASQAQPASPHVSQVQTTPPEMTQSRSTLPRSSGAQEDHVLPSPSHPAQPQSAGELRMPQSRAADAGGGTPSPQTPLQGNGDVTADVSARIEAPDLVRGVCADPEMLRLLRLVYGEDFLPSPPGPGRDGSREDGTLPWLQGLLLDGLAWLHWWAWRPPRFLLALGAATQLP